ncbi:hypothetical protein [Tsukamurella spumae]|uniref:Uncharacterized protein n=1 Tax=Tsukamurella spumae TaxID=44753 RepID=A0A846X215_9ACTN|nr:hypothetical protein [Tsukamurella spumae]NKY18616.1 hypothetical protein [Tsukamurella spumae]
MPARSAGGCGISEYRLAALSCLPGIDRGVPRPDGLTGQWIGSWVDFTGTAVTVGSLHGDPGVFNNGVGEPVPYGTAVTSGDYRCRPAEEGMYCRSLRHRSAVLMGRAFAAYGCREVPPEWGVGR